MKWRRGVTSWSTSWSNAPRHVQYVETVEGEPVTWRIRRFIGRIAGVKWILLLILVSIGCGAGSIAWFASTGPGDRWAEAWAPNVATTAFAVALGLAIFEPIVDSVDTHRARRLWSAAGQTATAQVNEAIRGVLSATGPFHPGATPREFALHIDPSPDPGEYLDAWVREIPPHLEALDRSLQRLDEALHHSGHLLSLHPIGIRAFAAALTVRRALSGMITRVSETLAEPNMLGVMEISGNLGFLESAVGSWTKEAVQVSEDLEVHAYPGLHPEGAVPADEDVAAETEGENDPMRE
jgi:hypothetical protein